VSGPSGRITVGRIAQIAPILQRVAAGLADDLHGNSPAHS